MHKDTALNFIKAKLAKDFQTRTAAAEALGVSRQNLRMAIDGHLNEIPQYLLEYAGLEASRPVVTYKKVWSRQ